MIELDECLRRRERILARAILRQIYIIRPEFSEEQSEHVRAVVEDSMRQIEDGLGGHLSVAELLVWSEDMWSVADSGARKFLDVEVTEDDIFAEHGFGMKPQLWLVPERYMGVHPDEDICTEAILIDHGRAPYGAVNGPPQGLLSWAIARNGDCSRWVMIPLPIAIPGRTIQSISHWDGEVATEGSASYVQGQVLAGIHFLRSKFAGAEARQFSRGLRRRSAREDKELPIVRVVNLREANDGIGADGDSSSTEYKHRWIVGWPAGCWRNQWYPSLGRHKPKLIAPYVKGPAGAPLLAPRETVSKVIR